MKTDLRKIVSAFSAVSGTVYGRGYTHPPESHAFFEAVFRTGLSRTPSGTPVRVLEIGCGNGYWLREAARIASDLRPSCDLFGMDVTPALIRQAQGSLGGLIPPKNLSVGDILSVGDAGGYHLCYAFDLVQQISRTDLPALFSRVRSLLEPEGLFLVIDRDPFSRYGISMNVRKFLTRRLGLRLVPDFYLLARYPAFHRLSRLADRSGFRVTDDLRGASRRALVLARREGQAPDGRIYRADHRSSTTSS